MKTGGERLGMAYAGQACYGWLKFDAVYQHGVRLKMPLWHVHWALPFGVVGSVIGIAETALQ